MIDLISPVKAAQVATKIEGWKKERKILRAMKNKQRLENAKASSSDINDREVIEIESTEISTASSKDSLVVVPDSSSHGHTTSTVEAV